MNTKFLLLFSLIGLFISCESKNDGYNQSTEINFIEIGKGALFGNGKEGISKTNLTISNTTDWQNLISKMNSFNNTSDDFKETDINFNEFTVLAIFLEVKNQGWEIETEKVVENLNNILVTTIETEYVTSVITQPFSIIKIPKTEKIISVE